MAHHPRWTSVVVEEVLDAVCAFRQAASDGIITADEAVRLEQELVEAARVAEIADLVDIAVDEIKRTAGLTPYTRRRAQRLGIEIAVLTPRMENTEERPG